MKSTTFLLITATILLLGLTGCAEVGFIASPYRNAADQRTFTLSYPIPLTTSFVDGAIAVGKKSDYQVVGVNRETNEVSLTRQTNFGLSILVGKTDATTVRIRLDADRRTIDIAVNMTGNFNEANQTAVEKIISDFETSLQRQFAT